MLVRTRSAFGVIFQPDGGIMAASLRDDMHGHTSVEEVDLKCTSQIVQAEILEAKPSRSHPKQLGDDARMARRRE